jgi:FkbM family methyltransferase
MNQAMQQRIRGLARQYGVGIENKPVSLLNHPERELGLSVEMVAAHYGYTHDDDITMIQVGAFDGQSYDPLYNLVKKKNWRGVLLEPQKHAFERLRETHKNQPGLTFVNAALSEEDGTRILYTVKKGAPGAAWAQELASFDKNHLLKHEGHIPNVVQYIEETIVDCITFDTLFQRYALTHVNILQIDTEGFDFEVIKLYNVAKRKPEIINFEHKHLSKEDWSSCVELLINQGYRVAKTGQDTLAYLVD